MKRTVLYSIAQFSFAVAVTAAVSVDERPAGPGEWGFRPRDGEASRVNPPGFVWRPQDDAANYRLQLSRTADFSEIAYEKNGLTLYAHCPPETLEAGEWFWRFSFATEGGQTSEWSRARNFTIPDDATAFPMPERDDLFSRIPDQHPRLFLRPEDLGELRKRAEGDLKPIYERLVRKCERLLDDPPPTEEPEKYPEGIERGSDAWREIWWGNRRYTINVLHGAATLAFTRLLDGNEAYGQLAKRLLMDAAEWDPKGATGYRYNDEAGMPYNYYFSRTYTFLYDLLSEKERAKCRAVMRIRGQEMFDHLHPGHIWQPYGSHANRAWHFMGEIAVAFFDEIEGSRDWLWYAMNIFYNAYPVWSDNDGGWHEGVAYWRSYIRRFLWWADIMRSAMDIDAYKKPFFSQAGYFAMYLQPPGAKDGGFGDLSGGRDSAGNVDLMRIFAAQAQNPHWQWYVEAHNREFEGDDYWDYVRGALPEVDAMPPSDLPESRAFWGTGLAMLHSDLTNAENDVFIEFKSSPFGGHSHGYEAQNTFLLTAYGEPIFIRTGRRDSYGSDHHRNWMWETESVNSILVNGEGQKPLRSQEARGRLNAFHTSKEFDYVEGEAQEAYGDRLDRFTRRILYFKPHAILILDDLEAPEVSTFQWLLHSPNQMDVMNESDAPARVTAVNGEAQCEATFLKPSGLRFSQNNKFNPPPRERIQLTQWHLTAETATKAANQRFAVLMTPSREDQAPDIRSETVEKATHTAYRLQLPEGAAIVIRRTTDATGEISAFDATTDAQLAVIRFDGNGRIDHAFIRKGTQLLFQGKKLQTKLPELNQSASR